MRKDQHAMTDRPVLLIADDDDDVVRLLRLFLRPLDCEILTAADGEEALAVAQERLPDVVLLDVMMPKKSGWEVCQALKAMQRTADIAVVLSTARGDVKDRLTGLQLGADGDSRAREREHALRSRHRPSDRGHGARPSEGNAHRSGTDRHRLRRHRA